MDIHQLKSITLSRGKLAYYDVGEGPFFVFLHGFPDTPESFEAQIQEFSSRGFRCIAPYMPGYGRSSPPANGCALPDVASVVNEFILAVTDGAPVYIYGHDWGSIVAQLLAYRKFKGKEEVCDIKKMILGGVPPMRSMVGNISLKQIYRSRYMAYLQIPGIAAHMRRSQLAYINTLWQRWSPNIPADHPQLLRVLVTLLSPGSLHNAINYYRYTLNPFYMWRKLPLEMLRMAWAKIPLPVLVVAGRQDGCIGPEMYIYSEKAYPDAESKLVYLDRAGHFAHIERSRAFNELIGSFLP